jgi:MFS family permease
MLHRLQSTYHEYPSRFWILVGASFVDRVGGTILQPFFALYITHRFGVGMTEAGLLFSVFSVSGFAGNMLGGALTDRFGRKGMVLFGLVFSALSSLTMGFVASLSTFYVLAVAVGLLSDVAGPAHGAMVADILPEHQRAEGFGVLRVVGNLAWIIGPTIGGLLASRSFLLLFILDAACSLITAAIVFRKLPETRPEARRTAERESMASTFRGYFKVLSDGVFVSFILMAALMNLVYLQMYSTLSVYLRDVHAVPAQGYGYLMSANAVLVVLTQFWITRRIRRYPPMLMMAVGTALYMIGFGAYGFVAVYPAFLAAMLVITVGEMIVVPVSNALVARFAPAEMRGRYIAIAGLSWGIPSAVGPLAAGIILDNYNPNLVWYSAGGLAAVAAVGFLALHSAARARLASTDLAAEAVPG